MRKLLYNCLLLLLGGNIGIAQEAYLPEANHANQVYAFNDQAVVRDAPYGEIMGELPLGQEMHIETVVDMSEFRGREDFWFEVSFNFRGRERNGYVWFDHLAKFGVTGADGIQFLYFEDKEDKAVIKVVKEGQLLDELEYEMPGGLVGRPTIQDNRGVKDWKNMLTIPYNKTSCTAFSSNVLLAWDGTEIHYVGLSKLDQNITDQDIRDQNVSISYIFPKDKGGRKGKILRIEKAVVEDEEEVSERHSVLKWTETGLIVIE